MPGVFSGLNHSLETHAWGRSRIPRSSNSSCKVARQSSRQVPLSPTLKLLRRRVSNYTSESDSQANFRCGINRSESHETSTIGWWHKLGICPTYTLYIEGSLAACQVGNIR